MGAIRKLEVNGWDLVVGEDDVPRVRDLDLGERLGFSRPRDFRKLVERLVRDGILNDIDCRATVARAKMGHGWREVTEYHLTERGALKAIVKSETVKAVEITGQVIDVYLAAREASRPAVGPSVVVPIAEVHGTRVGDTHARAEVVTWCQLAALSQGTTLHRVHGALRRQYKVPSVYALSVSVWPTARVFLEDLAMRRVDLQRKAVTGSTHLRLVQPSPQMPLPWGQRG